MMFYDRDPYMAPYRGVADSRYRRYVTVRQEMAGYNGRLSDAANNHLYYGTHVEGRDIVMREWAPNATAIYLVGDVNGWKEDERFRFVPSGSGNWELRLPLSMMPHGSLYKWSVHWEGGSWRPDRPYRWKYGFHGVPVNPFIYEAHIGMSSEEEKVAGFDYFRENVLPRIAALGYNTLQLMALQEHPYYGSFGYQVSCFFALSSRFGTPEQFKRLVDEAHRLGIG